MIENEDKIFLKFLEPYESYFVKYENRKNILKSDEKGWLYIFLTLIVDLKDKKIKMPENTYKIGKTDSTIYLRFSTYKNLVDLKDIEVIKCSLSEERESLLKNYIKNKTNIHPIYGLEYFYNCKNLLKIIILILVFIKDEIIVKVKPEIIINKVEEIINIIKNHNTFDLNNIEIDINNQNNIKLYNGDNNIVCKFCKNNYNSVSSLNYHLRTSKKCISQRNSSGETIDIKYLECEYCSKKFTQAQHLKSHLIICNKKDNKIVDELKKEIIELQNIIKQKDDIIKSLLKKEVKVLDNKENDLINKKYQEMKTKKINELLIFSDENILKITELINYKTLYNYDNFISEFIKAISCMTICTDISRNKLLIKNKDNEVESILSNKYIIIIFNLCRIKLLEIVNFLISNLENLDEEDTKKSLQNKNILKSLQNFKNLKNTLNEKLENSESITYISNLLSKNVELLPSMKQYKKLSFDNNNNLITDNNNIKNNKKIKKVRKVKNVYSDSESD